MLIFILTRVDKLRKSSRPHFSFAAIGGRLSKIFLPTECSGFHPPIGRQNFFWRHNILETAANRETGPTGGCRQKIIWKQDNLETAPSGFCLPTDGGHQTGGAVFASKCEKGIARFVNTEKKVGVFDRP